VQSGTLPGRSVWCSILCCTVRHHYTLCHTVQNKAFQEARLWAIELKLWNCLHGAESLLRREANSRSASQEIPCILLNIKVKSLFRAQIHPPTELRSIYILFRSDVTTGRV
jgi:hypothetical protein